jgi:hypothetical protein
MPLPTLRRRGIKKELQEAPLKRENSCPSRIPQDFDFHQIFSK